MNILYITSVFPRIEEGATIYTDLAESLTRSDHALTVAVADEHKTVSSATLTQERGIEVLRVRTGKIYNVGILTKGVSTLTLHYYMKKAIAKNLRNRTFDMILFETPPVSTYKTVAYAKKRFGAPAFLMLKDIFPQNGADLGLYKKNGIVYRFFRKQEKRLYEISDMIGCMSPANKAYILSHNSISAEKVVLFPNTKADSPAPEQTKSEIRKSLGLPEDKTIFMFGGNIGIPQSPDYIIACAKTLCRQPDAFFLVVGRGTHGGYVKTAMAQEPNFRLMENLPREKYEMLLSACDVGLVFLDKRFTIPNFPSRILSYMNFGLPVLAATDRTSDIGSLITDAKCGFSCISEHTDDFITRAKTLLQNPNLRKELGENGQRYFKAQLTAEKSAELLAQYAEAMLSQEGKR